MHCYGDRQVRTGGKVQNDDILSFAKLFNDELTLDNISRCMTVPPFAVG
jgi:LETM1 and EF-hand domain-containing protein 1